MFCLEQCLRLTFPRAKLRRQIFMTRGRIGRRIGRNVLCIFVLHLLCRMTHKSSPKIPPNLSLHVLWLKFKNFISASFWGFGAATNMGKDDLISLNSLENLFCGQNSLANGDARFWCPQLPRRLLGFLYRVGAETQVLVTAVLGKICS